ncbi:PREDICTED: lysine-specific demethylase 4A-like isoform X2 [Priapulus caudatus]|uniref:[histone H3]-trimethyl-L-lysine(9) demethylase n=1 Tax=Priapulus caudatus TaxID=37621 RepID=A0ABM1E9U7_PRICU|nr:PREDICTED: lysine-specific demethylase 4A-like isoform X2 [Priapulus caudatus]
MSHTGNTGASGNGPKIQVFHPTMEEFKDFPKYVDYIESCGAHKAGLAKVIPPREWKPRTTDYNNIDMIIPAPISQVVTGSQGLYQQYNIQKKAMTVKEYSIQANNDKYKTPYYRDYDDMERKYWRNIAYNSPIYGADISGSLYDEGVSEWNINRLGSILDAIDEEYGITIEGVNTAYLYFGMWKTTFPWHTEDMDLYSINYLHFGAPKFWYCIPPEHSKRLERLAAGFFPSSIQQCQAFLRHKMTIISPHMLKQYSIPYDKILQHKGEFMITFPYGYHMGFNTGYNCAESTNFATERWVEYGKRSAVCTCSKDMVRISMDTFVKRYQPDRYELWKAGKDIAAHPEDPHQYRPRVRVEKDDSSQTVVKREPPAELTLAAATVGIQATCEMIVKLEPLAVLPSSTITSQPPTITTTQPATVAASSIQVTHAQEENGHRTAEIPRVSASIMERLLAAGPAMQVTAVTGAAWSPTTAARTCPYARKPPAVCGRDAPTVVSTSPTAQPTLHAFPLAYPLAINSLSPTANHAGPSSAPYDDVNGGTRAPSVGVNVGVGTTCAQPDGRVAGGATVKHELAEQHIVVGAQVEVHSEVDNRERKEGERVTTHDARVKETMPKIIRHELVLSSEHNQEIEPPQLSPAYAPAFEVAYGDGLPSSVMATENDDEDDYSTAGPASNVAMFHPYSFAPSASPPATHQQQQQQTYDSLSGGSGSSHPGLDLITRVADDILNGKQIVAPSGASLVPELVVVRGERPGDAGAPTLSSVNWQQLLSAEMGRRGQEKKKARRHPIHKVHRNLEAVSSGEEDIPEEQLMPGWALELNRLWQSKPVAIDAEREYNAAMSLLEPHCAICQLLKVPEVGEERRGKSPRKSVPRLEAMPARSSPWVPEFCFSPTSMADDAALSVLPPMSHETLSRLLVCSRCRVCVHARCYGVAETEDAEPWNCRRCEQEQLPAECCLCSLRGGALKPTTGGGWAHIVCALVIPEVGFVDADKREPISVTRITPARLRLKCTFCYAWMKYKQPASQACIQCSAGKCSMSFHVTCAVAAGILFENCDWPFLIYVACPRHLVNKEKSVKPISARQNSEVDEGEQMIAKHKNGRYYRCVVISVKKQVFYEADFLDGSYSENLFPQDVVSHDCLKNGPPPMDGPCRIKWTDGKVYDAIFKATHDHTMCLVEFEDGSELTVKRGVLYTLGESLPKKVKSRLSLATDRRRTYRPHCCNVAVVGYRQTTYLPSSLL